MLYTLQEKLYNYQFSKKNFDKINQDVPLRFLPYRSSKHSEALEKTLFSPNSCSTQSSRVFEDYTLRDTCDRDMAFAAKTDGDWRKSKGWAPV